MLSFKFKARLCHFYQKIGASTSVSQTYWHYPCYGQDVCYDETSYEESQVGHSVLGS